MTTFPVLDEEPPPPTQRARLRRSLILLAVLIVFLGAAAGGWGVYNAVSGGGSGGASGSILVMTSDARLALVGTDGRKPAYFASVGIIGGGTYGTTIAPNGGAIYTEAGDIVVLSKGRPVSHSTALYGPLSAVTGQFGASPVGFTGGSDRVVYSGDYSPDTGVSKYWMISSHGGRSVALGIGGTAAGDPQQIGAFLTVPTDPKAHVASERGEAAVTSVVHVSLATGTSKVTTTPVVTAAQVAKDLGQGSTPLALYLTPDPSGKYLAVNADNAATGASAGVAVYSRTGRFVGATRSKDWVVQWARSGSTLLLRTPTGAGLWTVGRPVDDIALPADARVIQGCAWSPNDSYVACAGSDGRSGHLSDWVLINRSKHSAKVTPGTVTPLLWNKS